MPRVTGKLVGATQVNHLAFHASTATDPTGNGLYHTDTDASGNFSIDVAAGRYRIAVNHSCWATSPNPLLVPPNGVAGVQVTAPCTQ
jgi:hypothetical protein